VITEIGEGVTQLAVGDRVILACVSSCGKCSTVARASIATVSTLRAWRNRVDLRLHDRRDAGRIRSGPLRRELGLQVPDGMTDAEGILALGHPAGPASRSALQYGQVSPGTSSP